MTISVVSVNATNFISFLHSATVPECPKSGAGSNQGPITN